MTEKKSVQPVRSVDVVPPKKFGFPHLLRALEQYAASARCENDLDREVVLERMRQEFETEAEVLLRRGFDKAYRRIVEGV